MALASASDLTFNWVGFISAMVSNLTFGFRAVWSKKCAPPPAPMVSQGLGARLSPARAGVCHALPPWAFITFWVQDSGVECMLLGLLVSCMPRIAVLHSVKPYRVI